VPLRLGIAREQIAELAGERRRVHRLGQDAQSRAPGWLLRGEGGSNSPEKRRPRADLADPGERLRTVRIVEAQHAGLREDVGRAEAPGMLRIALDLGRPSF